MLGEWDNYKELVSYCETDVRGLSHIVKAMHEHAMDLFHMSPWKNMTAPSFYHEVSLLARTRELKLEMNIDEQDPNYLNVLVDHAKTKTWAVLKPWEHQFASMALRGGRTEIRNMVYTLAPEEWDRGVRIRYQDVNSLYPYQQMVHRFPVGVPVVHYWNPIYKPCFLPAHRKADYCSCMHLDACKNDRYISSVFRTEQPNSDEVMNWFGIVRVTLVPPKDLFHPVLLCFNPLLKKCVSSLRDEDHVAITITSVELQAALKVGYVLKEVHAFHQYHSRESLWKDGTYRMYLEKMLNSRDAPIEEERVEFMKRWDDVFPGIGKMMVGTWDRWGKNKAKKQMNKIGLNSGWGKHAQGLQLTETLILSKDSPKEIVDLMLDYSSRALKFERCYELNQDQILYQHSNNQSLNNYHGTYMPAAVFVPAYGRLQLWEQLHKLGDRVLMCDTDSIVYIYDPELYNVPEPIIDNDPMAGEWELEDVDKVKGIMEFCAWGPKSYSMKFRDGSEIVKAKGLNLNRATTSLFNHRVMMNGVKEFLENGSMTPIMIPQSVFSWTIMTQMSTFFMKKVARITKSEMKGSLQGSILYPFGHEKCQVIES